MSTLSIDDIKKLSDLSKIDLSENEEAKILLDINSILDHVSNISNFDTEDVDPVYEFNSNVKVDTIDQVSHMRETLLSNIPNKSSDNFVKVSKVIKK